MHNFTRRGSFSSCLKPARRHGIKGFAIAVSLALFFVPAGALAMSPPANSAQVLQTAPAATDPNTTAATTKAGTAQDQDYASREANAKGVDKFEGGSTVIVLGGTGLAVIVLVIVLIVLL